MNKKLLLCMGLLIGAETIFCYDFAGFDSRGTFYRIQRDRSFLDKYGKYIFGGCTALVVSVYLWNRESNGNVECRVNGLYGLICRELKKDGITIDTFAQKADISVAQRETIFQLKKCVINRYGSWLKPWDWTAGMQKAYQNITAISALYGYLPLLLKHETLTGEDVLHFARESFVFMTQYPCIICLRNLEHDVDYLHNNMNSYNSSVGCMLSKVLPILERAKNILRSEKELLDEMKAKTTHDLQHAQLLATLSRR